jgi:L-lactate dehydrogenase complex protein LldG
VADVTAAFRAQAVRIGASVHATTRAEASARAVEILREEGCLSAAVAAVVPDRSEFVRALRAAGLSEVPTATLWPTRRADGGISTATLGVAETGSTLLHSTSEDRRVELCVDVHLVLLDVATLVPTLDPAFRVLRDLSARGRGRAYVTLVTGPSRSADIERQITIGVHGPRALHILLPEPGP